MSIKQRLGALKWWVKYFDKTDIEVGNGGSVCNPNNLRGRNLEHDRLRSAWAKREIVSQKCPIQKRGAWIAQVGEHMPSKCEVLSSNPVKKSTLKKKDWHRTKTMRHTTNSRNTSKDWYP